LIKHRGEGGRGDPGGEGRGGSGVGRGREKICHHLICYNNYGDLFTPLLCLKLLALSLSLSPSLSLEIAQV
jgi:hypothetical protein